jgi:hypothetical protein
VHQGLPDADVVERRAAGVERQATGVAAQVLEVVDALEVAGPDDGALPERLHDVDVTALQGGQAGVLVGDRAEHDLVEVGLAVLPVVRVLLHDQPAVALPALEHERTGADRVGAGVGAGGGRGGRRERPAGCAHEEVGEGGVGLGQLVDDGEVVDDVERGHLGQLGGEP